MASLVNYDIYEDSTEENEQVDKVIGFFLHSTLFQYF